MQRKLINGVWFKINNSSCWLQSENLPGRGKQSPFGKQGRGRGLWHRTAPWQALLDSSLWGTAEGRGEDPGCGFDLSINGLSYKSPRTPILTWSATMPAESIVPTCSYHTLCFMYGISVVSTGIISERSAFNCAHFWFYATSWFTKFSPGTETWSTIALQFESVISMFNFDTRM